MLHQLIISATFGDMLWVKYHQDLPIAIEKFRREGPLGRAEDIEHLKPARVKEIVKYRLGRVRSAIWRGDLRQRIVPIGSERERW